MAGAEAAVRASIDSDRDCTEKALAQMELRRKINLLIGEWKAAGGGDVLPDVRNPVRLHFVKTVGRSGRAISRR
ncbi:hypothetical protein CO669_10375 [Bradyrhizobium sp. Y36]|uniref:hypothetical protein n=1 Tax=Bradyrhizobium sp. Y36 TaxID=2035447 RepID=UPI000BE8ACAC|nr:hypothetical protein [Bradyrhizobium sp. Y36]PDT90568.1 hypothetical protein CO669_10375 [Bradyrhizobium sp. Y36]